MVEFFLVVMVWRYVIGQKLFREGPQGSFSRLGFSLVLDMNGWRVLFVMVLDVNFINHVQTNSI